MPKRDMNQIAFAVVQQATEQTEKLPETTKAISGRKGGLKGGVVRASTLTAEERSTIAKKAAATRWRNLNGH